MGLGILIFAGLAIGYGIIYVADWTTESDEERDSREAREKFKELR